MREHTAVGKARRLSHLCMRPVLRLTSAEVAALCLGLHWFQAAGKVAHGKLSRNGLLFLLPRLSHTGSTGGKRDQGHLSSLLLKPVPRLSDNWHTIRKNDISLGRWGTEISEARREDQGSWGRTTMLRERLILQVQTETEMCEAENLAVYMGEVVVCGYSF